MNNVVSIAEILSSAGSVPPFTCVFPAQLFLKYHFAFFSTFARANTSHDSSSVVTKSKIESSTVDSPRGEGGRAVQKRRLQIWISRGPSFEEHRAEVCMPFSVSRHSDNVVFFVMRFIHTIGQIVASVAAKAEAGAAKK